MRDSTANDHGPVPSRLSFAAALRAVAVPFLVTRAGVLLIGLTATLVFGYTPKPGEPSAWRIAADPALNLLARWDTFWYLDIATHGYRWNGNPLEQQNVVFFPLLPLLMRVGGAAIGGHPLLAGAALSLTAFLLALGYFWRWTAHRLGAETATAAVWLLSTFPSAIFYSAIYTESLYLLIAVAACYYVERRRFGRAAVFGFLGGLARPNGLLLAIPIGWLALVRERDRRRMLTRVLATVAPGLGVLCFSAYLAGTVGDGTAWVTNQAAWPHNLNTPADDLQAAVNFWWVPNALPLALVVIAVAPLTHLLGVAYGLFVVGNIAPPLLRHGLLSMGRFSSVMFPVFAWLATCVHGRTRTRIVVLFAVGQAVLAALFFTWHPIV